MKKSILLLAALTSLQVLAYDGEQILEILEPGVYEGLNQDGLCYVTVKTFNVTKPTVVVEINKNKTGSVSAARFNELSSYETASIKKVENGLVYNNEREARGVLDAAQKAKLEIMSDSTDTEVYIEKKVKTFFGWRIEESASCVL